MTRTIEAPLRMAGAWDIYPLGGLKRLARHAIKQLVFFIYLHCGWISLRDAVLSWMGRSRIVILYYHRVGWMDVLSKPTSDFRAEMQYLVRNYQCLTLRQLVELLQSGARLRRKIAVVTFDDGYRDNYYSAFPELRRAGLVGTFFVSTGYIGTDRKFPHDTRAARAGRAVRDDWPKMSWIELREMQQAGMEIGSHTVGHVNLGQANAATVNKELRESMEKIRAELGPGIRAFCFPWGNEGDFNDESVKAVRDSGYYAAVTTVRGSVTRADDLFQLRRIDIGNGQFTRLASFAAIEGFGCGWLARLLRQ